MDMTKDARMKRAVALGYSWAELGSCDALAYDTKPLCTGNRDAQKFSKYLAGREILHKKQITNTRSTYITILGEPYKTRCGGYSAMELEYRFSTHSKKAYQKYSILGAKQIDRTYQADVFPRGNTLDDAIKKLENTIGVKSINDEFDLEEFKKLDEEKVNAPH